MSAVGWVGLVLLIVMMIIGYRQITRLVATSGPEVSSRECAVGLICYVVGWPMFLYYAFTI